MKKRSFISSFYFKFLLIDNERVILSVKTHQILRGIQRICGIFKLTKNHSTLRKHIAINVKRHYVDRFIVLARTKRYFHKATRLSRDIDCNHGGCYFSIFDSILPIGWQNNFAFVVAHYCACHDGDKYNQGIKV